MKNCSQVESAKDEKCCNVVVGIEIKKPEKLSLKNATYIEVGDYGISIEMHDSEIAKVRDQKIEEDGVKHKE